MSDGGEAHGLTGSSPPEREDMRMEVGKQVVQI